MGYKANYGFADGSGDYWITIDSGSCNGCEKCVSVCPEKVFEVVPDDYDDMVARVRDDVVKKLKYVCTICKPASGEAHLLCQEACPGKAIKHSW